MFVLVIGILTKLISRHSNLFC